MNYQHLQNEMQDYFNYFKYWDSITSKFTIFFKDFSKSGGKFIMKSKKLIEDIFNEINKE